MSRTRVLIVLLVIACSRKTEQAVAPAPANTATTVTEATQTTAAAPVQPPTTAAPSTPANLASQETNWKGITATITEFRRKGNTLTAKVKLQNGGSTQSKYEFRYDQTFLIDTAAGKKYEVLKDEKGAYIAGLLPGWNERHYGTLDPGESFTAWMKFPAPPADVKAITLQTAEMAPFEDVSIQD